jgi:TBCC domain-containing protein 1
VEALRLQFIKQHLSDLLDLFAVEASGGGKSVSKSAIDSLSFLFSGGPNFNSEVLHLSSLLPFWAEDQEARFEYSEPVSSVLDWWSAHLTINEVAYPPASPPLHHVSAPGLCNDESDEQQMHEKSAKLMHDTVPVICPLVLNGLSRCTTIKTVDAFASSEPGSHKTQEADLRIQFCTDCHIYILAPVRFASVLGCSDCTIVIGASAGVVNIDHCENVTVTTCCQRLKISNCLDSIFFSFTRSSPMLSGDNRALKLAPHNTQYPQLEDHLKQALLLSSPNQVLTVACTSSLCRSSPLVPLSSARIHVMSLTRPPPL